jgi:hypothetical protein
LTVIACNGLAARTRAGTCLLVVTFPMSHRPPYTSDIPQYVGEAGDIAELQDGEEDEAMEEVAEEQGYGESDCEYIGVTS